MPPENSKIFFSYSRTDSEFVLKLATDLSSAGFNIWVDQMDLPAGERWDLVTEEALRDCEFVIVVLSPKSVASNEVMNELNFAIQNGKKIIPLLYHNCEIPYRLNRIQYIDFTNHYEHGLRKLLASLNIAPATERLKTAEPKRDSSLPAIATESKSQRSTGSALVVTTISITVLSLAGWLFFYLTLGDQLNTAETFVVMGFSAVLVFTVKGFYKYLKGSHRQNE